MDRYTRWPLYFSTCGTPINQSYASYQNLGDSKRYEKNSFAVLYSVDNKFLGKLTEAFERIPSSFGTVVRKPGLDSGG